MKERIILVHGTQFHSGDPGDAMPLPPPEDRRSAKAWWEEGATFRNFLRNRLKTDSETEFEIQHWEWSGQNTETARRKAGRELLQHLRELDRQGEPYHVVAHSHGGSVLWHALTESLPFRSLKNLKSAITIGTPYLVFRPRRTPLAYTAMLVGVGALLYRDDFGAGTYLGSLAGWFYRDFTGTLHNLRHLQTEAVVPTIAGTLFLLAFLYFVIRLLRIAIIPTLLWPTHYIRRLRHRSAWRTYRNRYVALYSRKDEAIRGLQNLVDPTPMRLFAIRTKTPSGQRPLASKVLRTLCAPYNLLIAPLLDHAVSRRMWDRAQGADLQHLRLTTVRFSPRLGERRCELSKKDSDDLIREADLAAISTLKDVREALVQEAEATSQGGVQRAVKALSRMALIHTTYFQSLNVKNTIVDTLLGNGTCKTEPVVPTRRRFHVPEFVAHGLVGVATVLIVVGLHSLFGVLNRDLSESGMLAHAATHRPPMAKIIDPFATGREGLARRDACRGWLDTLAGMGRIDEALLDAQDLPNAEFAWVATALYKAAEEPDPEDPEGTDGPRGHCVDALQAAFGVVAQRSTDTLEEASCRSSADETARARNALRARLRSVFAATVLCLTEDPDGPLFSDLDWQLRAVRDADEELTRGDATCALDEIDDRWKDLKGLLRSYADLYFALEGERPASQPDLDALFPRTPPPEVVARREVVAFMLGALAASGDADATEPDLFTLVERSMIDQERTDENLRVTVDPCLRAGIQGARIRVAGLNPEEHGWLQEQAPEMPSGDEFERHGVELRRSIRQSATAVHLASKLTADCDQERERLRPLLVTATDALNHGGARLDATTRRLSCIANVFLAWAKYEVEPASDLRRAAIKMAIDTAQDLAEPLERRTTNSLFAKASVVYARANVPPTVLKDAGAGHSFPQVVRAIQLAESIIDNVRQQIKVDDIVNIIALSREERRDPDQFAEQRVRRLLNIADRGQDQGTDEAPGRGDELSDEDAVTPDRATFGAKLARRIRDPERRSRLILQIAQKCNEQRLRGLAKELIAECRPSDQALFWAKFWEEALKQKSED